jgi:hypothetical protein
VTQRLRHAAGVVDVTEADVVPSVGSGGVVKVSLPGHGKPSNGWARVDAGVVGTRFLATYGMHVLEGRFFAKADNAQGAPAVVVDRQFAKTFWPHDNPLHRELVLNPGTKQARTVTVVGVGKTLSLDGMLGTSRPGMLLPLAQAGPSGLLPGVGLAVRTHAPAVAFQRQLVAAVHGVDPRAAVYRMRTQAHCMRVARLGLVLLTEVFGVLGVIALVLAAAGLYGVLAFSIEQRTREIGIRRAIGAGNGAIVRLVARQLAWQLGAGLVVGVVLAVPWTTMLSGVNPALQMQAHDPAVFAPVFGLVVIVSMLAVLVPLTRALRVDPEVALRDE